MKSIKQYIVACGAISLMMVGACTNSFLDVESKTESNTDNFYKSISDAQRALNGCYDGWQCTSGTTTYTFYIASEIMADECFGGVGMSDSFQHQIIDRFVGSLSSSLANIFEDSWKAYYAGIYRCNELITREEQIDWEGNETLRGTYMGECRALRALMYFDMVRLWGNIPLLTAPTSDNVPQSDPAEVYAVIVDDLKYAIENIPANAYPKANAADNDGRITKYAAEALLARVYLYYTGYYGTELAGVTRAEVLAGLEDIISSNEYALVDEFKNLWPAASSTPVEGEHRFNSTYAGDGNSETVLAQKFNYTQDYNGNTDGNRWLVMMGIRSISYSPYGRGWGACTVHPKMWNIYGENDTRREASIINLEREGITNVSGFSTTHLVDQREYTGYTVKKYTPMAYADGTDAVSGLGIGDFQVSQYQDYVVMRYADVLLMAAELGSSNARTYLNNVRRRAYVQDESGAVASNFREVEATQDNIMNERMLEFAFEGIRYWDLLRQGVSYAAQQIAESGVTVKDGGADVSVTISAANIIEKQGLSQIPNNQITLSDNVLKQNPGW